MLPTRTVLRTVLLASIMGCSNDGSTDRPYVEFAGGGFVFNYRTAIVDYGFVVTVKRKLEPGTLLEATFENPSGGKPFAQSATAESGRIQYTFRTPPVQGVEANRGYQVVLRILDPRGQQVLATYERHFRSDVDQSVLSKGPLTIGPGYHKPAEPH